MEPNAANEPTPQMALDALIQIIMARCPLVEHERLGVIRAKEIIEAAFLPKPSNVVPME